MPEVDFRKELKQLYFPPRKEVVIIDVPSMNFLMIDGEGDPNTAQSYQDAVQALYGVSFALKFLIKENKAMDYVVMPLEGLWWVAEKNKFKVEVKDDWKWTSMVMQPRYVTLDLFEKALDEVKKKKKLTALSKIRFEKFKEGIAAQIMHVGPYSEEATTVEKIHDFIWENGYRLRGRQHEIYLSDPHRTAPEKLKTIIRQPISRE